MSKYSAHHEGDKKNKRKRKKKSKIEEPNLQHVLITEASLPTGILLKNKHLLGDANSYHKFMVNNVGNANRNDILTAILDHIYPLDLIPVSFWKEDNFVNFLGRNCGPAIEKLCENGLLVPNPNSDTPFMLCIVLKYITTAKFEKDTEDNVYHVLTKRYNAVTKVLNLSNFLDDSDLLEFTPLFQPKILYFVLKISQSLTPKPETYILSNNRIKLLEPLEVLTDSPNCVKCIDLQSNLIDTMDGLHHLVPLKLSELVLDGNPVCSIHTASDYVSSVTSILKDLTVLDELPIRNEGLPTFRKNFLYDIDAAHAINQFVEYYFYLYDMPDRTIIKKAYNQSVMFSLTSSYHEHQLSSSVTRLQAYNVISRNLHDMANYNPATDNIMHGRDDIVRLLKGLPRTEHCNHSFVVDVMQYTNCFAIVSVSGVFKEFGEKLLESERYYGFRRTFALKIKSGGICQIVNELLHIHNAFSWQSLNSFKHAKSLTQTIDYPQTDDDRNKAVDAFKLLTTLNTEWSKKCLEDRQYNMKNALKLFLDLYKQNLIPADGFKECRKSKIRENQNKEEKYNGQLFVDVNSQDLTPVDGFKECRKNKTQENQNKEEKYNGQLFVDVNSQDLTPVDGFKECRKNKTQENQNKEEKYNGQLFLDVNTEDLIPVDVKKCENKTRGKRENKRRYHRRYYDLVKKFKLN